MTAAFDVAVVGAGPVGCVTALSFARRGASVLLLEANPKASGRLAGEWLHPPAVDILKSLDVSLDGLGGPHGARGFALFPDDGSEQVVLPYSQGEGISLEHAGLVERLREACQGHPDVRYQPFARVTEVSGQRLAISCRDADLPYAHADLVVGAAGRVSSLHQSLDRRREAATYSRMSGLLLHDVELPSEGYGHVFLGGPGPILAYRIADNTVRMCLDVPLDKRLGRRREAALWMPIARCCPSRCARRSCVLCAAVRVTGPPIKHAHAQSSVARDSLWLEMQLDTIIRSLRSG